MKDLILKPINRKHWYLTDTQKQCLDASIFFPLPKDFLYMYFVDRKCTATFAKQASKSLFAEPQAQEYISERKKWIDENWFGIDQEQEKPKRKRLTEEERAELAQGMLDEMLLTGVALDATTLRMAIEKGLSKVEETREEKPRLYVPVRCLSCAYREFCETHGENICPKCKFRAFAIEHGCEEFEYNAILNE